ncbi:Mitochondrial inner membrane protease subunit 1 [Colletotrichum trifolii]|uniref:Mitochondrial inner membrane protease subunit 1 n=1 Tax=Colletotrichum trifolii TaxID=5466 RepID=A0A4R8RKD7_COLTR|nr:Mitochondrial inner membrane protease subunit 1 [Colletotrichum trifolii]
MSPASAVAGHPFRLVLSTIKTMFAAHVFWEYGYSWGPTAGASMLPTFDIQGDYALVDKRYRLGRNIAVGDLVNYRIPIFKNSEGVKRVIGMPGDYVLVNSPDAPGDMMIQVPKGHCWIVGDNLEFSRDSRHFGPVPLGLIEGKVVAKPMPWSSRQIFRNALVKPEDEGRGANGKDQP